MIPYDDLVIALAGWRAKQGLAVAPLASGTFSATPRGTPPAPPGRGATTQSTAPAGFVDDAVDVDDALLEEAYENEGDFAIPFNPPLEPALEDAESTAIGVAPPPPHSFGNPPAEPDAITENRPPVKHRGDTDW